MLLTQGFSQGQPLTSGNDGDKVSRAAESQGRQRPDPGYQNPFPWWAVAAFEVLFYFKEAKLGTIRREMRCDAYKDGSALLTCRRWPSLGGLHHA